MVARATSPLHGCASDVPSAFRLSRRRLILILSLVGTVCLPIIALWWLGCTSLNAALLEARRARFPLGASEGTTDDISSRFIQNDLIALSTCEYEIAESLRLCGISTPNAVSLHALIREPLVTGQVTSPAAQQRAETIAGVAEQYLPTIRSITQRHMVRQWKLNANLPLAMREPPVASPRLTFGIVACAVWTALERGDGAAAAGMISDLVGVGKLVARDIDVVSAMRVLTYDEESVRMVAYALSLRTWKDEDLTSFEQSLSGLDFADDIQVLLVSNYARLWQEERRIADGDSAEWLQTLPLRVWRLIPGLVNLDLAGGLRYLVEDAQGMTLRSIEARDWYSLREEGAWPLPDRNFVAKLRAYLPICPDILRAMRAEAALQATRCAIAVERYRLANGHWPRMLADLGLDTLGVNERDPFTDGILRFAHEPWGVRIWSVGGNMNDDGGNHTHNSVGLGPDDVNVDVLEPALRPCGESR